MIQWAALRMSLAMRHSANKVKGIILSHCFARPQCLTARSVCAGKANGSSDRVVADMDDQSREVEQGIASALCQALPLLSVVIRDAAAQTTSPVWLCSVPAVVRDQLSLMNIMQPAYPDCPQPLVQVQCF